MGNTASTPRLSRQAAALLAAYDAARDAERAALAALLAAALAEPAPDRELCPRQLRGQSLADGMAPDRG